MGSPVQERGDSEGSPDGTAQGPEWGGGDSPAIPDGWAWPAAGGVGSVRSLTPTTCVGVPECDRGLRESQCPRLEVVVLFLGPRPLAWVWGPYNLSTQLPRHLAPAPSPSFSSGQSQDFGTQKSPCGNQGASDFSFVSLPIPT